MARAAPAATRAASILAFLTANPSRGFRISELAEHLGMNLASAHATLAVLCDAGFLLRDPVHRTYVLGPALAVTGFAALEQHPAVEAAIEQAEVLANELSAEIGVTAIAGRDVIFLARRGGPPALATSIGYPGDRSPLLAPIGAIFMAWADDDAVHEWLARAELPPLLASSYREILGEIRERGFSVPLPAIGSPAVHDAMTHVRSEPTDPGAERHLADVLQQSDEMLAPLGRFSPTDEIVYKTVAAPIFDPLGRVLLSLSITGPDYAVTVDEVLRLGHRLAQAATIATRHVRGRASGFELPMGTAVSGGIHVTTTRVGFIGVGSQGGPMARRIVEEGFPLTLWARRPDSLAPYADTDTEIAATPAELGAASDLVGICVVADADVEDVLLRPDGVLAGMAPGGLIAIHATVHPETCRRLADAAAERGVAVVDAPVSGGGHMAAVRKLLVMVGGADDDVARIRPVFETFADPIIHLGPLGSGQVAKLLNNFVFTAQIAVSLDTYSFAQDLGVDRSALAQVLAHGSGGSTVAGIIAGMNFDLAGMAQVAAGLLRKDVGLTLDVARGAGAVPPAALVGLTDDALAAIDSA